MYVFIKLIALISQSKPLLQAENWRWENLAVRCISEGVVVCFGFIRYVNNGSV